MNDNLKRHSAIFRVLKQVYGFRANSHAWCHMLTLASLISGIIGSQKAHLPAIATKTGTKKPKTGTKKPPKLCLGGKRESIQKQYARWVQNKNVTFELFFAPFARAVLASLSDQTLVLVMDGSDVGRGCLALVLSVVFHGRALPLAWTVVKGKKGHFPEEAHQTLLKQVLPMLPKESLVRFLGDGEFDGIGLLATLDQCKWGYVCRTAKNTNLQDKEGHVFSPQDLPIQKGEAWECADVLFTAKEFGPVQVVAVWEVEAKEPIYLVSNLEDIQQVPVWYKKRFRIETFFSDQKSRGFHLHKSHLSDPARLFRLMIATCLAYYWVVLLGAHVVKSGFLPLIHRKKRCDLSLFQIGLIWIEYCLNHQRDIQVPIPRPPVSRQSRRPIESVR